VTCAALSCGVRVRGSGLVFKARMLCVSLNSRLESNKEEEEVRGVGKRTLGARRGLRACRGSPTGGLRATLLRVDNS